MADTRVIAKWLKQDQLEGRRKSITVGPGNAAIVIKNGVYGDPHIEERVYTKGVIPNPFGAHEIEVLDVDLTPFAVTFELNNLQPEPQDSGASRFPRPLLSKDGKLVLGQVVLTLRADRERPHLLYQLRHGRPAITSSDIAEAIRGVFLTQVIATNLAAIDSHELRGTAEHFRRLYADTRLQLEEQLKVFGLTLVSFAPALLPDDAIVDWNPDPGPIINGGVRPPVPPPVLSGGPPKWRFLVYAGALGGIVAALFFWFGGFETGDVDGFVSIPSDAVIVNHWATGHFFFEGGLQEMADKFNAEKHQTASGQQIYIEMSNNPSSLQARDLLSRAKDGVSEEYICCPPGGPDPHPNPVIVTPSSAHWLIRVNDELAKVDKPPAVDLEAAESIAVTYIGIVTYREMAECLGWPEKPIGYADIIALRAHDDGWGSLPCARAEWGTKPLVAFTDPKESSTGRSVLLALYAIASGKAPEDMQVEDITDPDVVEYVKEFQGLVDHYMVGTTALLTKIHQGPRFGHFLIMPEDNLIHLKEGGIKAYVNGIETVVGAYEPSMVMIYPKEGSLARSNCACIVSADWVTDLQKEGAQEWIEFLHLEEQQRVFMSRGFRPATGLVLGPNDPDNRIRDEFGLNPVIPDPILSVSKIRPDVAAKIDDSWVDVKRPGIVTFVVDTSGSMDGEKMEKAKDGLILALDTMADHNQVGLIPFGSDVDPGVPIAPLSENRSRLGDAVFAMDPVGQTILYDAIRAGVELSDAAEGAENAIRAVVVLTDGRANRGVTELDDIIDITTRDETVIRNYSGMVGGPNPVDVSGRTVSVDDVSGDRLAIETEHEIQIFFIGIGEDADLTIGGLLAEATGAEFVGVTEEDLAEVLAEFSGYF
jgi:Ca-activated chloride channel family protein